MTLATIWGSILLLAGIGATMIGVGITLSCNKRSWKLKRATSEMLTTTGTILTMIAFYSAFVVATTELVLTVTQTFGH